MRDDETGGGGGRGGGGVLRGLGILVLVGVLILGAVLGGAMVSFGFRIWDKAEGTVTTSVRAAPGVVLAVRELSRLETSTYHIERVIDQTETEERLYGLLKTKDAILLVAAADISAGVDLSKLGDGDVEADPAAGRVTLTLPAPEVLSTRLDTDRTYVHTRTTDVLAKRKEDLESRARQVASETLREAALEAGILEHARTSAERTLRSLLASFGYHTVEIRWRDR